MIAHLAPTASKSAPARLSTSSRPVIAPYRTSVLARRVIPRPAHEPPLDPGLDLLVTRARVLTPHPLPVKVNPEVRHLERQPEPLRLRRVHRKLHTPILRQAIPRPGTTRAVRSSG